MNLDARTRTAWQIHSALVIRMDGEKQVPPLRQG
jgi:hypothetical protein